MNIHDIGKWIGDNWPYILAGLAALDGGAGVIPDKFVPYIGIIRRVIGAVIAAKQSKTPEAPK